MIGKPGGRGSFKYDGNVPRVPSINLAGFNPAYFLTGAIHRHATTHTGTDLLPALAALLRPQLEAEVVAIIDSLPKSAFGVSEEARQKRKAKLEAELKAVQAEIESLERAWAEEVGEDVHIPT